MLNYLMLSRHLLLMIIITLLAQCQSNTIKLQKYDLSAFTIEIPEDWVYEKKKGIDSFIGAFKKNDQSINFDYSTIGAQGNIESLEDYFISRLWASSKGCVFCEDSLVNTSGEDMWSLLRPGIEWVIHIDNNLKKDYPNADFIAKFKYNNQAKVIGFKIPKRFKSRKIENYKSGNFLLRYFFKDQKNAKKTVVASYEDLSSLRGIMIRAENIPSEDLDLMIKTLKTIRFAE